LQNVHGILCVLASKVIIMICNVAGREKAHAKLGQEMILSQNLMFNPCWLGQKLVLGTRELGRAQSQDSMWQRGRQTFHGNRCNIRWLLVCPFDHELRMLMQFIQQRSLNDGDDYVDVT
jgi:hypothetical protein